MATLSRVFVVANRIFGGLAALGGLSLLLNCAWAVAHGRRIADVWIGAAFGVIALFAGVVYLRAPLFRNSNNSKSAPGTGR